MTDEMTVEQKLYIIAKDFTEALRVILSGLGVEFTEDTTNMAFHAMNVAFMLGHSYGEEAAKMAKFLSGGLAEPTDAPGQDGFVVTEAVVHPTDLTAGVKIEFKAPSGIYFPQDVMALSLQLLQSVAVAEHYASLTRYLVRVVGKSEKSAHAMLLSYSRFCKLEEEGNARQGQG